MRTRHQNINLEKMSIGHMDKSNPNSMVYVGNLVYSKTEQSLFDLFKRYGFVNFVRVNRDKKTLRSKGIAFVQMRDASSALKAVNSLNGTQLDGRTLKASIALNNPKAKKQRRR